MSRQAFHSRYTSIAELAADTLYRRLLEGAGTSPSLERTKLDTISWSASATRGSSRS